VRTVHINYFACDVNTYFISDIPLLDISMMNRFISQLDSIMLLL